MPSKNPVAKLFPTVRPKLAAIPGGPRVHAPTDMLGPDHFKIAIFFAVLVHLVVFGVWAVLPKQKVIEVPVHTLSIKLGDTATYSNDELEDVAPNSDNKSDVEATLAKLVRDPAADAARADSMAGAMDRAMGVAKNADDDALQKHATFDALKQFVRTPMTQAKESATSEEQKDVVARYETLVSMWIQKFKVIPPEAKTLKSVKETLLRLQIDRQGNIRNFVLEGSTGNTALDHAAIDMVRRANPVPAVPTDYPAGELFEFVVPVQFGEP